MRILFVTPYITSRAHLALLRNQTGFGYMVHDIAESVSKLEKVNVFSAMTFTHELKVDGVTVLGRSWWTWLKSIRWSNICDGFHFIKSYPQSLKKQMRTLYIFASVGQLERIVNQYDMVHIHGCGELTEAVLAACRRQRVSFMVTLHGLNSFENKVKISRAMKLQEKDFLVNAAKKEWPVSFISTGNKDTAESYVRSVCEEANPNFFVITNGCNVKAQPETEDIRGFYHIDRDDFVFTFVGNISENKNQLQVAHAWMLLPNEEKYKCKVLFVGKYSETDEVVNFIREHHLEQDLVLCGIQPKDKVPQFYQTADATILTSKTEGFGLSIIEGFVYGKPNVTFADLPAVPDLYDEKAMVLAKDRSNQSLAKAMEEVMHRTNDAEYIKKYVRKFSFELMAEHYIKAYEKILNRNH